MEKDKKKIIKRPSAVMAILFVILLLYTLSLVIPFIWTILTSVKSRQEFIMNGPLAFPKAISLDNYIKADQFFVYRIATATGSREIKLAEMFLNSITYSLGMAAVATISPCIMAYLTAKYRYKFSGFIYGLAVTLMLIPVVGNMASMIVVLRTLRIYDTYFGMLCMKSGFIGTYYIIMYSICKGLSNGYSEAARIDGASETAIMFKIVFPLVRTSISAIFLLNFVAMWNDYLSPLMYYPSHPTASLGLMVYSQNSRVNSVPDKLAGTILVILPILVLYLCFKKYLMGNLTMGGLKG